ncbi:helix-turn-helix transcriptional regulator [Pseudoalteromonas 'SMAR']|uniref:helix-turn-helix transcriptional regulator n=1 Tax=Pseudoalteromonas 'SMAR' TaxID=3416908 RepID=UPI003AF231E2
MNASAFLFMPPILTLGLFAAYTHNLNATWHRHHLIQVNLANGDCDTHLPEQFITGASVINSNVLHRVNMAAGWVLLVEPQSHYGQQLKARLQQANGMKVVLESVVNADMQLSDLTSVLKLSGSNPMATDSRIVSLLQQLDACASGQACLQPQHINARDVAATLCLSESRFLHLFKAQMATPWRPYILWHRLTCAIRALQRGDNLTMAAAIAGFADSAHLSRTFKRQFGLTPSEALHTQR